MSCVNLPQSSSEIWEKFMSFEASVGDLSSLLKVEQRRAAAMRSQVARKQGVPPAHPHLSYSP